MYQDVLQSFQIEQLRGIHGFDDMFNEQELEMLNEHDVFVESDVSSVLEFESVRDTVEVIPLRPDEDGNYNLAAARARKTLREDTKSFLHLGTIKTKHTPVNKVVKELVTFKAWGPGDTFDSMLDDKWHDAFKETDPPVRRAPTRTPQPAHHAPGLGGECVKHIPATSIIHPFPLPCTRPPTEPPP